MRRGLVREAGRPWPEEATGAMQGMSSPEWSGYMHEELGLEAAPEDIAGEVVRRMGERYRERLPLLTGARQAVRRLARRFPLGVASSSNRPLVDLALELAGVADAFRATVSSEEVARGKPAPDVYLEACRRLGVAPARAAAVEDSTSGLRAARAAGMRVIAIPNRRYAPDPEALAAADVVLPSLAALWPRVVDPGAA